MTLADLAFLATALGLAVCAVGGVWAALTHHPRRVRQCFITLLAWLGAYVGVMVLVSLLAPRRTLELGHEICFDDLCFSIVRAQPLAAIGPPDRSFDPTSRFWVVTVQMRSAARGVSQRNGLLGMLLVDAAGRSYDPSAAGQQAWHAKQRTAPSAGLPWSEQLAPGQSSTREIVFRLPLLERHPAAIITEGAWISAWIIGDENSLFHPKTHLLLGAS